MENEKISDFLKKHNISLTRQQMAAVSETDGHILLSAVPGSGKTTVLITRLGYMVYELKIPQQKILTITYTVAATNDMKNRFVKFFGEEYAEKLEFRTINGLCQKIISYYNGRSAKDPFSLLSDDKKIFEIIASCHRKRTGEYLSEGEIKDINTMIGYAKNMLLTDDEIKELDREIYSFSDIFKDYNKEMRNKKLMDYNDQLVYAWKILTKFPQILAEFRNKYDYICVDEAQDTSKIQHMIIDLLANGNKNLFMVGDEDQSIYGFRAAYPQALTEFPKKYPDSKILFLETNFRSDAEIVKKADNFIKNNKFRLTKTMIPARAGNNTISIIGCQNVNAQYSYAVNIAKNCKTQTAVLYRNNDSAIPVIDMLERENIPYKTDKNDNSFFTNRVVQDIKDIISFAYDMTDINIFLRIYYKINLFLTKDIALSIPKDSGKNILELLLNRSDLFADCGYAIKKMLNEFILINSCSSVNAISKIVSDMGYGSYLNRNNIDTRKISILYLLAKFTDTPAEFIKRLNTLEYEIKNHINPSDCNFILSTIHSSKGLEYDSVYLMDVYDGILPESTQSVMISPYNKKETAALEEERRLFYVAMTRAKNRLYIFRPDNKKCSFTDIIRKEIPVIKPISPKNSLQPKFHDGHLPVSAPDQLTSGDTVFHTKFGQGTITDMKNDTIRIKFNGTESKKFSISVLIKNNCLYRQESRK